MKTKLTRWIEIPHGSRTPEVKNPHLNMFLEQTIDRGDNIHQHDIKDSENFQGISHHLVVQIRIIIKHVIGININPLSFNLNHLTYRRHILPFPKQIVAALFRFPEMLNEHLNRGFDILDADVGPPDERRRGVVGAVFSAVVGRGRRFVGVGWSRWTVGSGGGGARCGGSGVWDSEAGRRRRSGELRRGGGSCSTAAAEGGGGGVGVADWA